MIKKDVVTISAIGKTLIKRNIFIDRNQSISGETCNYSEIIN